jgi:hypothetical protein
MVRSCIPRFRRCTIRWPLWGENSALTVGFTLQSLLESFARPFAPFRLNFHFNFSQGRPARLFSIHPFPLVRVSFVCG